MRPQGIGQVVALTKMVRADNRTIVATSGSFDLLHLGHVAYLENASRHGDYLIVGVDSDQKIRLRKGPTRPYVEENERARLVSHQRGVDAVYLKGIEPLPHFFIRAVRPDVLVVTEDTYPKEVLEELRKDLSCKIVIFKRFTDGSSTQKALSIANRVSKENPCET